MKIRATTIFKTALFAAAWIAAVALGLGLLLNYESRPGRIGAVPATWPAASRIPLATDQPTLVMLAHPRCPCTRASVDELARMTAQVKGRIGAYVLFLKPQGSGGDWEDTGLRRTAAKIPGVKVLSDPDGVEARHFGAETSGHTLLFAADGQLLFSGGITQLRGHAGDNVGENAILSLVNNHVAARNRTSVLGCSLFNHTKKKAAGQCSR